MTTPVKASEWDLRALADIVSADRPDLPSAGGLPPSLLADLMGQICCDGLLLQGYDSGEQLNWGKQGLPVPAGDAESESLGEIDKAAWEHYWDCQFCSYVDRTSDLRSVIKITDFYSARQWRSTGMRSDIYRPMGLEHQLQLCLPAAPRPAAGMGRTIRLCLFRGPGPDFSERDRAVLTLLRPHLREAYLDAERLRRGTPQLTPRQWELLRQVAAGHTNAQIARKLGLSEGTVRKHLENTYARLNVSSRTAAVTRAFPDG